mmetsp:Transcript_40276/g.114020  ORF Transcript_40276/g.114020 Transcript_40276/m.114020 type:complete len:252 (+) Transcript_40276:722-1477(+)
MVEAALLVEVEGSTQSPVQRVPLAVHHHGDPAVDHGHGAHGAGLGGHVAVQAGAEVRPRAGAFALLRPSAARVRCSGFDFAAWTSLPLAAGATQLGCLTGRACGGRRWHRPAVAVAIGPQPAVPLSSSLNCHHDGMPERVRLCVIKPLCNHCPCGGVDDDGSIGPAWPFVPNGSTRTGSNVHAGQAGSHLLPNEILRCLRERAGLIVSQVGVRRSPRDGPMRAPGAVLLLCCWRMQGNLSKPRLQAVLLDD